MSTWSWGRALEVATWMATAAMGLLALTEIFEIGQPYPLPLVQSLAPYLLLPALPLAAAWNLRRRYALAISNGIVGLSFLALLAPATMGSPPPRPPDDAPRLRIAAANVLAGNPRPADAAAALMALDADVLAVTELTGPVADALERAGAAATYPYHEVHVGFGGEGIGLYSRLPIESVTAEPVGSRRAIDAVLLVGGRRVRILAVHPLTPVLDGREAWPSDLAAIGRAASEGDGPTVVLGDFNASRWHPDFRRLLRRGHLRDAHEWTGDGLDTSWPANRRIPPFIRIDHILVRSGAVPTDTAVRRIPGSDHEAVIADLAIT